MNLLITALIVIIGIAAMLFIGAFNKRNPIRVSPLNSINFQFGYQGMLLIATVVLMAVLMAIYPAAMTHFLSVGDINAPVTPVPWLGIANGETWNSLGPSLALTITGVTAIFIYLSFRKTGANIKSLVPYLPWIILFSILNAFSEEAIFRIGIIVPLAGHIDPQTIMIISAIAFGLPHYRGMPNGIVGVLMSAALGWLLAKSVLETGGVFWALSIHTLQDIVIISAFILADISKHQKT